MIELKNLTASFDGAAALRDATLSISPGDRLGVVGESGSGKTLLALCLMGMAPDAAQITGEIHIDGTDMTGAPENDWQTLRARRVAMVFQEPMAALNPLRRVGDTVAEPLMVHEDLSRDAALARALTLFNEVGIHDPESRLRQFPHQLSGGQRQRVLIALALAFVGRQRWEALDALEDATGVSHGLTVRLVAGTVLITALTLSGMFLGRADRTAFGLLTLLSVVGTAWVLLSPLREPSKAALRGGGRLVSAIYRGRIHRALSRLSPQQQVGVLFLTLGALLFLVPLVPEMDLRLMLLTLLGLLMFSTLGTLLLGMLEHAASLRITLRWLAIAGTLPFLLFFLNVERERLVHAGITSEMVDHLLAYALVWGLGVGLALLLSRILSVSILAPLTAIMASVEAVRGGDFSARTGVSRRDEIGGLADAVDHMAEGLAQRERLKQTFRRYVDPRVADRLIAGDASMSEGRLQHATVLFSDVRGFTTMSEGLEPAQVVSLLNDYLALMAPIITRWGGVIDKFIGDAVMAVWEVPRPITEGPLAGIPTERLAVEAAAEMLAALDDFNTQLVARGLPSVAVGVGINSGEVLAGPLGSPDRLEYTVIGDVVNTAQRLEGAARGENTLLVSASVAEMVRPWVELVELEPMALKGKRAPVPLWRVACIREPLVTGITPPATTTGPA